MVMTTFKRNFTFDENVMARLSSEDHNEILGIIDSSIDYDMFVRRLNNWASYRLEGGIGALPEGLRLIQ